MINIYLLDKGIGISDGKAVSTEAPVEFVFHNAPVDSVLINEQMHPVVRGRALIHLNDLEGTVSVIARCSVTRRIYPCDSLYVTDGRAIPIQNFTPAEYVAMAEAADKATKLLLSKIEKLEAAVYGIPLFGKE